MTDLFEPRALPEGVPAGFALKCHACDWLPDPAITMGVVKAHYETQHGSDAVALELVVLCPRHRAPMTPAGRHGDHDLFECAQPRCFRYSKVRRPT